MVINTSFVLIYRWMHGINNQYHNDIKIVISINVDIWGDVKLGERIFVRMTYCLVNSTCFKLFASYNIL